MKKRLSIPMLLLGILCLGPLCRAQSENKPAFEYDLLAKTYFDNRENDGNPTPFTPSMTLFGQQLTPQVGVSFGKDGMRHKFMAGVDASFYFGSTAKPFGRLDKVLAYYKFDKEFEDGGTFTVIGGIYPKTYYRGAYTNAFVSDSAKFTGRNSQGLLLSYEREKFFVEALCYWIGIKDGLTRERFQIWSFARYDFLPWLRLGYAFSMDHYACSDVAPNVVDNLLLRPYLAFDLSSLVPLQRLYADIGGYVSYQRDRTFPEYYMPGGVELNAEIRHWNVGVRNTLYVGTNLEPLFDRRDPAGTRYAHRLYIDEHYYRVRNDGSADNAMLPYDRLEVFYEPKLWPGVNLELKLVFHFNGALSGTQQIIGLKADLNKILGRSR